MVTVIITQKDRAQGDKEYIPTANEDQENYSEDDQTEWRRLTRREQLEHTAMHLQGDLSLDAPLLSNARRITAATPFTISDSSLRMPEYTGT